MKLKKSQQSGTTLKVASKNPVGTSNAHRSQDFAAAPPFLQKFLCYVRSIPSAWRCIALMILSGSMLRKLQPSAKQMDMIEAFATDKNTLNSLYQGYIELRHKSYASSVRIDSSIPEGQRRYVLKVAFQEFQRLAPKLEFTFSDAVTWDVAAKSGYALYHEL